jgi:hypothetical protein
LVIRKRNQEHLPGHQKELVGTADAKDSVEDYIIANDRTDQAELRDQIAQLPIESPLSLDEFLNPEDETIVNDIFAAIVECYSVDQPGKEEQSSDKEEEVEQIKDAEALRIVERLKLWKVQRGTDQDIKALDRIKREIVGVESSVAYQTTISQFF